MKIWTRCVKCRCEFNSRDMWPVPGFRVFRFCIGCFSPREAMNMAYALEAGKEENC